MTAASPGPPGSGDIRYAVPPAMAETARRLAAGETAPVAARDAATVVLLRDSPSGVEAYLLRRTRSMAFAGGMVVFPGGSVDPRDAELSDELWEGPEPARWSERLHAGDELVRALVCAAVRETFEESGVLLAGPDACHVVDDVSGESWEADRRALVDHSLSLAELLSRRRLRLRADLLRVWAHWVTPEAEQRRFDTRFFLAAMPAGQRTRDVGGEADAVFWARPVDALAARDAGRIGLLPPTATALADLAGDRDVAAALVLADARPVERTMPRVELAADGSAALVVGPGGS